MPTNYTGSSIAVQTPPGVAPVLGGHPVVAIVNDGDTLNSSTAWQQPLKELADWSDLFSQTLAPIRGIYAWNSSTTYQVGAAVLDNVNSHIYRAKSINTNVQPSANPTTWDRIDWTAAEIAANSGVLVVATSGISVSHGAAVATSRMLSFAGGLIKMINFLVTSVPGDSYADVDLSASTTLFTSNVFTVSGSAQWGAASTPNIIGVSANVGGNCNVFRVYFNRSLILSNGGSFPVICDVAVTAWGY
jgi:hypothetical protein